MNTADITQAVHRAFDAAGTYPSLPEILHEFGAGIRPAIVDKALDDAVQGGALLRRRIDGVLRYLPAPAQAAAENKPAAPERGPAAAPPQAQAQSAKPLPTSANAAGRKLTFSVKLAKPASRNMPAGLGKWDEVFDALFAITPTADLVPTVDDLPIGKAKAISSAARSWAKKRDLKPCPIRISTRTGKLLVQRF